MKHYCISNLLPCFVACVFVQTVNLPAQITTLSEVQSNAAILLQTLRSNANAQAENRRLHPDPEDVQWVSNVVAHLGSPEPWPDPAKRKQIFEYCASVVRSSLDTNELDLQVAKLTNEPASAIELKELVKVAIADLHEFARILTNPQLRTYIADGFSADLATSTNLFYGCFWTNNLAKDLQIKTPDGQRVLISARFYEDGKLMAFHVNSRDTKGVYRADIDLVLNEDGTLRSHMKRHEEIKP